MDVKRSYRPLIAVILISGFACGFTWFFMARSQTIVRAPCVLYPAGYSEIQSPVRLGLVTEVLKKNGDTVKANDEILRIDAEDEKFQREAIQKQIAGIKETIKEQERYVAVQVTLRKALAEQARVTEKGAAALVDIAKARVSAAEAVLKRAGKAASDVEIRIATEKLNFAVKDEERMRLTKENYEEMFKNKAATEFEVRKATIDFEKAQSLVKELKEQLKLLTEADTVFRLEDAQAELKRRQAEERSAVADVATKHAEVLSAEAAIGAADVNEKGKQLAVEVDRLTVEEKRIEGLISQRVVRATTPGLIQDFRVAPGQWISDRLPLGMLYDNSSFVVYAHVQQKDVGKIVVGQKAKIMFDGIPRDEGAIEATVVSIEPMATPPKEDPIEPTAIFQEPLKGAWTPRALVKLKVADGPNTVRLRVGFTGSVKILIDARHPLAEWFFY